MSNIFFTADTHFGHANIILYSKRPWLNPKKDLDGAGNWISPEAARRCAAEMDEALVANWNEKVGDHDRVYHLGDFCFGRTNSDFRRYFERLRGDIVFIKGNHDKLAWRNRAAFLEAHDTYLEIEENNQLITLCHYAMRVWNKSHYGAWHLYGHSHGTLRDDPHLCAIDVGVDCHDFRPVSYKEVKAIMAGKTFKPVDHHGVRRK